MNTITITSTLALFTLLALSTGLFFLAKRLKFPYTVLLVIAGMVIVGLTKLPVVGGLFGFLDDLALTPALLFFIFLPVLIFESGFNMNSRKMIGSIGTIMLMAVVGMLISAFLVAGAIYFLLPLLGLKIPFVLALLFGAIISATDPVAVLALFKEFGAPKRLTMLFEGESLFNDGTAVALFMVLLSIVAEGFHGMSTVVSGMSMFVSMMLFGIIFGLLMAMLFSRALRMAKKNEFVVVTMLIISAHLVFILAELINEHGLFGLNIHVSSIVATTITSLFLGNYSRHILAPRIDEYLGKFIEHMAFVANSLVFILAGILFASSKIDLAHLWLPILVTVLVVATVRAISVVVVTGVVNAAKIEEKIPQNWQALLAWGSLRGALAVIVILLIPEDFTLEGWSYAYSPRELLLALTIGCILTTLFIKAPLMSPIMRKLRINKPDPLKEVHESDLGIYYLYTESARLKSHRKRGFIEKEQYDVVRKGVQKRLDEALEERQQMLDQYGQKMFERSLYLTAIRIERAALRQLYINEEITESMLRIINGKLILQRENVEAGTHHNINPSTHQDHKDVFNKLATISQMFVPAKKKVSPVEERFQYYRAQAIIARKAMKVLSIMQKEYKKPVFHEAAFNAFIDKYEKYKLDAVAKMDKLLDKHSEELEPYVMRLSRRSIRASGGRALEFLRSKGIATEELEQEIERRFAVRW